jgi:hypothetical protein
VNDYYENLMGTETPAPSDSAAGETSWSSTSSGGTTRTQVGTGVRAMFKKTLFDLIRPLFVRDIMPDEEFLCEECRAPVLRRTVFCSRDCHQAHSDRWLRRFNSYK